MKVYISCVHSGPNPVAGLGIARSLRQAFPQAHLVGVDYATRSSGLHSSYFDDVQVQPPWDDLDLPAYGTYIRSVLDDGAYWISSLDLENTWLRDTLGAHPYLIAPPQAALAATRKPHIAAAKTLPLHMPPIITRAASDPDWHAFCREHGWNVFIKGPNYEAYRVHNWQEVLQARQELGDRWATGEIFAQAGIPGVEESIAFSAYDGRLLDAVYLQKRDITVEGKTWAARIDPVDGHLLAPLRETLARLKWTGGGELECIRDHAGKLWLIDLNPRFPAWIHGATLAGHNLPGALFAAVTGQPAEPVSRQSHDFTRIVLEIPCRPELPLPPMTENVDTTIRNLKTPAGMPRLAQRIYDRDDTRPTAPDVPDDFFSDLAGLDVPNLQTPQIIRLQQTTRAALRHFADRAIEASTARVQVQPAYSIKTEPSPTLLEQARDEGFLAEAISQYEAGMALAYGFSPEQIILNGPAKWWPTRAHRAADFGQVFADSIEELQSYQSDPPAVIGIRLRLPSMQSRFGVLLEPFRQFQRLLRTLDDFPAETRLALHFHFASDTIGFKRWWQMYQALLNWGVHLQHLTERPVVRLDIGGGWSPDDIKVSLLPNLRQAVQIAEARLPHLESVLLEPGKALSQPTAALLVRVLEVRQMAKNRRDVVVDGAISDLPMAYHYPHRILARTESGNWQALAAGSDRILGRLCMESDILAPEIRLPPELQAGDVMAICDAGAYDRSMAYAFGTG
jgi:diaminopimelate decarboxylase